MQIADEIKNLETQYDEFSKDVVRVQHEYKLMQENHEKTKELILKYENDREVHKKAVELLTVVQGVTRDKIKDGFETLVTYALRFIYSQDYAFQLEFGRRGNLQELNFNIKTPEFEEACDPMDTSGGGVLDIVSLALRAVLLEVSVPKIEGFLMLDESLKHLSKDYLMNASEFLNELNKRLGRQIIFITHQQEFIDNAENAIEIK
jgi:DNA repair exonuclease SbcCD ATPase subunit